MRELRRKLLKGTDDEDAYEHVQRVLKIANLFHFPGVTHDVWCHLSPLADFISHRDMYRAGLSSSSKVADLFATGSLVWPHDLMSKYPTLLDISSPTISVGILDKLEWKSWNGMIKPFSSSLKMILSFIIPMAKRRTSKCVITKLVIAASVYFIWKERNNRLFNNDKRTADQVIECILSSIRLKLMLRRFKKSKVGGDVLKRRNLPKSLCS
nr:hypothetical protein [Tanacetum cinerariifolium]